MDPRIEEPVRRDIVRPIIAEDEYFNMIQNFNRRRALEIQNDKIMINEWFLMTGQTMDTEDLSRLKSNHSKCHGTRLQPKDFERLKATWLTLTGTMDLNDLHKLKRDYILMNQSRMNHNDFLILKKYWPLVSESVDLNDLETLKRDYLVLNWSKMNEIDYTTFKTNWFALAERTGIDNQDNIIKGWLRNGIHHMEYRYMNKRRKIEFTKFYLERGADANYSVHGYTLLHSFAGDRLMLIAPLIELLLSYGADVTVRTPNGWTVLDKIRIYYYKDHDDIISMLQVAEKAIRKNTESSKPQLYVAEDKQCISSTDRDNNAQSELNAKLNKAEQQWIQPYESIYLKTIIDLLNRVNLRDIDGLLLSAINYMFISKTPRIYIKFSQNINRVDNITRIHQIYSRMCSKLFNAFDLHFTHSINISFPPTTKLCEDAELVASFEIHPELEWVALKLFAVPSDIEYYIYCVAGSRFCFSLSRDHRDDFSICSANLLCEYEQYFSAEQQRRLRQI